MSDLEEKVKQLFEESGFDSPAQPTPAGEPRAGQPTHNPTTPPVDANGQDSATVSTDIARIAVNLGLSKLVVSYSLPAMLGFVQEMSGPEGFIYALTDRNKTAIPGNADDNVLTRKLVKTTIREVKMDLTNEVKEDISKMFGKEFENLLQAWKESGGTVWDNNDNLVLPTFLLQVGLAKMVQKVNTDFTTWLDSVATDKGTATITSYSEMQNIYGIIGELREQLYRTTQKSGKVWILVTPKIAAYLSSTMGSAHSNGAMVYETRPVVDNFHNGYVMDMGDVKVFQYNPNGDLKGGEGMVPETHGKIFIGFRGGADVSSVFYCPFEEYIVEGGSDYFTGQNSVFFRVRDAWSTNPLDTYDYTNTDTGVVEQPNKSEYVLKANITFTSTLLQ